MKSFVILALLRQSVFSASVRPGNTAPFKVMPQRWRAFGNTVRFQPQTSRSRDKRDTARLTGRFET